MAIILISALWIGFSGSVIQVRDIRSIILKVPASDADVQSLRESFAGPPDFQVLDIGDYSAPPLPPGSDLNAMLSRVMSTVRSAAASADLRFVELRMLDGGPVGLVNDQLPTKDARGNNKAEIMRVDALSGALLYHGTPPRQSRQPNSIRGDFKGYHSMNFLNKLLRNISPKALNGSWGNIVGEITGLGLLILIITGLMMYFKILKVRIQSGNTSPFWQSGGWWRSSHRAVSLVAALFLTVVIVSGMGIAFEGLYFQINHYVVTRGDALPYVWGAGVDASSRLKDAELPAMLDVTLAAQHAAFPQSPVKVVRLRYFGTMAQGVVVSGDGWTTRQTVFNTATGKSVSETEAGYPNTALPFGWQVHQTMKSIHRGDFLGLPGSHLSGHVMALLAGLSLVYLSASGLAIYLKLWQGRRRAGRGKPFWV